MEFRYGQPETEIEVLEEKARHYYTYYILPKEKKVPSLLDSISTAREGETLRCGGLESSLGADSLLLERVKQDKLAVDLLVRQIEEREILKAHHLITIDEEMSYAKEKIWHFDLWYMGRSRSADRPCPASVLSDRRAISQEDGGCLPSHQTSSRMGGLPLQTPLGEQTPSSHDRGLEPA